MLGNLIMLYKYYVDTILQTCNYLYPCMFLCVSITFFCFYLFQSHPPQDHLKPYSNLTADWLLDSDFITHLDLDLENYLN
jgi:hypothetical protein